VGTLGEPGIIAHGVALKPGKPLCLAAVRHQGRTVPVAVLPGFPTSAIFTFQEFIAPVIRRMAGRPEEPADVASARLPMRVNSEKGRTEYLLVGLVATGDGYAAYPMGKGSGSVTTFSRADGFVVIPRQREYLEAGDRVDVRLLGRGLRPAELVVIGSHCVGLDYLLGRLQEGGTRAKFLAVGSTGGLTAARRGECDLAGVHLLDPATNVYNRPYLGDELLLIPGYGRLQGIVFRRGDPRFEGRSVAEAVAAALADTECVLVNRNRGSGTRVLIDGLLGASRPPGYLTEARSHNAVAAAVAQGRADWGVAIANVAAGLGFLPLQEEQYDFIVPKGRWDRPALRAFRDLLERQDVRDALAAMGFTPAR
jgi:putative molybdopterin biosynthesis protein